jgi:hypothetical protein
MNKLEIQEIKATGSHWRSACLISIPKTEGFRFRGSPHCSAEPVQKPAKRQGWLLSAHAFWSLLIQSPGGITVSLLHQISTLFLGNNHSPEYTSYLNSCYRCLLEWTHYQTQQAQSTLATASLRFDKMRRGRRSLHLRNSLVSTVGNLFTRSRDWSFRHLRTPLVTAVGSLFRHLNNAEIAEESAQFCLAGLSRFAATDAPNVALKPHTDRAIFRVLDLKPQLLLLSAGNLH